jgi:hypothetical protein
MWPTDFPFIWYPFYMISLYMQNWSIGFLKTVFEVNACILWVCLCLSVSVLRYCQPDDWQVPVVMIDMWQLCVLFLLVKKCERLVLQRQVITPIIQASFPIRSHTLENKCLSPRPTPSKTNIHVRISQVPLSKTNRLTSVLPTALHWGKPINKSQKKLTINPRTSQLSKSTF